MSSLHVGAHLKADQAKALGLAGSWSVWSKAGECPGGVFVVPADDTARNSGLKYVVIRAVMKQTAIEPALSLVRADPPDLAPTPTANQHKGATR